jgi:uncharacterized membrane protein
MSDLYRDRSIRLSERQERWGYGIAGAALLAWGMRRGPISRLIAMAIGGGLLYRTATGESPIERLAQLIPSTGDYGEGREIHVQSNITVSADPDEIFRFWRNLENLPRFMQHLDSVRQIDDRRSHWKAIGPAGTRFQWDAEIVREEPGRELAWQSLPGASVSSRGVVMFRPASSGQGTEIEVRMEYRPPAGRLGAAIARLFGEEPQQQIDDDLQRLRRMVDAGELHSIEASASGGDGQQPGSVGGSQYSGRLQ